VSAHPTCRDGVAALMDYLEGLVPAPRRAALEGHVAGCPRCIAFVQSYREMPRILRSATAMEPPAEMAASLRRFLFERI